MIRVQCYICRVTLRRNDLSIETARAAHRAGGSVSDGIQFLSPEEIVCDVCASYSGTNLPLDEYTDLLDDIGADFLPEIPEWYRQEYPDKCRRRADLDALRLNY